MEAEPNPWNQHWIHGSKAESIKAAMYSLMRSSFHESGTVLIKARVKQWKRHWIHGNVAESMEEALESPMRGSIHGSGTGIIEAGLNP